jgi:DNA (cytosine-5)-methyltransferase 1
MSKKLRTARSIAAPTAVDLFAGAGGLSLGLTRAGFKVIAAAENWPPAASSYRRNFHHALVESDLGAIRSDDLLQLLGVRSGEVDLVAGGPPCQGFSIQRIGPDSDVRNNLVMAFADHVVAMRPRMFLMENVPGLLGSRGRALVDELQALWTRAGYSVRCTVVDAQDYGVPQRRRRVVFCGWRKGVPAPAWPPATSAERVTVRQAIEDLPSPPKDYSATPGDPLHRRMRISKLNQERLRHIPPGGGFEDLPVRLRVDCHKEGAERIGHRNVYGRLHPDEPAATITARFDSFTRGQFAHPFEDRNITLREGARLQTFPDDFTFVGTQEEIAAQIGNAVPPVLAEALAGEAYARLSEASDSSVDRVVGQLDLPLVADV